MQSKWHNISVRTEIFNELQTLQKQLPIRVSIPQTIEWLIDVGQKQINSELQNENTKQEGPPGDLREPLLLSSHGLDCFSLEKYAWKQ